MLLFRQFPKVFYVMHHHKAFNLYGPFAAAIK
jgi:hypothetical protein